MGIAEKDLAVIESETDAAIDEATEEARNSRPPPADIAHIDVWADGSASWRN